LKLLTGEEITLDYSDYLFVKDYKWIKVTNSKGQILIKREDVRIYLHRFLLGKEHDDFEFCQLNNDPFDYRRENILSIPKRRKRQKKREIEKLSNFSGSIASIVENHATIRRTRKTHRSLECEICCELDLDVYDRCLTFCAENYWNGWKPSSCRRAEAISGAIKEADGHEIPEYILEERIEMAFKRTQNNG